MDSDTIFSSLPVSLRLRILEELNWAESLQARLVCADWHQFINHIKPPKFLVTDKPADDSGGENEDNNSDEDVGDNDDPEGNDEDEHVDGDEGQQPELPDAEEDPAPPELDQEEPDKANNGAGVVLPCLINSYYEKIGTLQVKKLSTPLPITSSHRMQLPRAFVLILSKGNSVENILKLVRYYARTVSELWLQFDCLSQINSRLLSHALVWNQMTRLDIYVDIAPVFSKGSRRIQDEMRVWMHVRALAAMLVSLRVPNLVDLVVYMLLVFCRDPVEDTCLVNPLNKFAVGLDRFLSVHGPRLVYLTLRVPCTDILNCCKHMATSRLKLLELTYEVEYDQMFDAMYGLRTDLRIPLGYFKNLVHLHLCPSSIKFNESFQLEHENIHHSSTALILANNKHTLRYFTYTSGEVYNGYIENGFHAFSWLIPNLNLRQLKLGNVNFDNGNIDSPRLEYVTEFSLHLAGPVDHDEDNNVAELANTDWSAAALHWIGKTMPVLQNLSVQTRSRTPAGLAVRKLIEKLASLRQIKLQYFLGEMEDFDGISEQLKEWIDSTEGRVEWLKEDEEKSWSKYKILIRRALS